MYDVIIIGAGPTGLTAAIYASRRMMKTLVISKNIGGQVVWASEIENFPGIKLIKGPALIGGMLEQVKNMGVEIKTGEVSKITRRKDGSFTINIANEEFVTKTIVVAAGLSSRKLNLPNEKELTGRGISYCANCDGPFFKGKTVAVVGGGNAAFDAAEVMSKIASNVYLICRDAKLGCFESLEEKVRKIANVKIVFVNEITGIIGSKKLEKIKIINTVDKTEKELEIDGLFIEIGHEPKTDMLADLVKRDTLGQIIVDLNGKTSLDGIFAAGDVTANEFKQIIIGCGQGAVAALSAYKFIQEGK